MLLGIYLLDEQVKPQIQTYAYDGNILDMILKAGRLRTRVLMSHREGRRKDVIGIDRIQATEAPATGTK